MPIEVRLPELGENIETGDVLKVLVSQGDTLKEDQPILELETDKATIEVPSPAAGTVSDVRIKAGDKVTVGQVLILVADGSAPVAGEEHSPPGPAPEREAVSDPPPPAQGPGASRSESASGDAPSLGTAPPGAEAAGPRAEVVDISRGTRPPAGAEVPSAAPAVPAAPSVRGFARELGVDINLVPGSGPEGRIGLDDVKAYARWVMTHAAPPASPAAAPAPGLPDFSRWGEVERRPLTGVRRKTAEHLAQAWSAIPHVTQDDRADITELERLRKRYEVRVSQAAEGARLTVTAIALKIAAAALRVFPAFASSLDTERGEIVYKQYVHIGVAVDTDRGLLVPVIRDVDRKSILQLSVELARAAERARSRKLSIDEMEGGVFTITNLGGLGGTSFTPIVNHPEVAILGISRGRTEPVWIDGRFEPRLMLPLSLSYDHRVIDGADAVRFLRWIVDAFEQPFLLSLYP